MLYQTRCPFRHDEGVHESQHLILGFWHRETTFRLLQMKQPDEYQLFLFLAHNQWHVSKTKKR